MGGSIGAGVGQYTSIAVDSNNKIHISYWDVSQITNMTRLFNDKKTFNEDISRWDVSNVTNMKGMFAHADAFNQPIQAWNVGLICRGYDRDCCWVVGGELDPD